MTQDELDKLPQMGGWRVVQEIRDGKKVEFIAEGELFALHHPADEDIVVSDYLGRRWMLGWHDGIRYKRAL